MIHAERMAVMGQRLTYYRIHRESSAMATKDSRPLDFLTAFWDFKSYLQDQGLYEELRVSFVNWALSSSFYNLYTMKTLDGYLQVFHAIKEGGLESLGADEISPDQYHDWGVRADVEALRSSSDLQFMYRWIRIVDDAKEDAVAWIDFISMDRESELASLNHRLGTVEEELAVSREEARQLQEEVKRLQDNLTVANELLDQADRRLNATEQKVGQAICYVPRLIQRAVIARSNARPSDGNEV